MADSTPFRYRAFLSYSKRDQQHAKRLHSALEAYRVPKGIDAPFQQNRRLGRFFRDDDEMGASTDLGGTLREALENSENLIVICSPHAARSKWVNAEIQHFKNTGRGNRIFAVVVDGVPQAEDPELNCFPPALGTQIVSEALLSERHAEPLGIDLRKEPFKRARIRLVAGLLGISFDSLWQREKRRAVKRRALAAGATAALVAVIVLLGTRWLTERSRVQAQRIDRTLATVRDDLASERVKEALAQLASLTDEGERGPVEAVLTSTLSWVSTPAELLNEIKPPAFVSNGTQLFFISTNGSRNAVNIHEPYRRVLSSDKRWLLILGSEEALMLDVADGREVARTASNKTGWVGAAFETGSGLLVVAGRYSGISNSSHKESFLVFSPARQTLTVFDRHMAGDGGQYRFIQPLYVSSDCRSFGVVSEDVSFADPEVPPDPAQMVFISADGNGLQTAPAPESVEGWRATIMFVDEQDRLGLERYSVGQDMSPEMGCRVPASDSKRSYEKQILTGPVRPIALGAFWESEQRWKVTGDVEESRFASDSDFAESNPCTETQKCPVNDPERDRLFPELELERVRITSPRGVPRSDRSFERVDGEFVHSYFTHFNAGFDSAWCRKLNGKTVCLTIGTPAELHDDETDADLRSPMGRFIFYSQAAARGFRLYDLLTMRNVTPKGPELVASTYWADFSPDDKRLFLAMNGRLLVFEPQADESPWQSVSSGGPVEIPVLSGNLEDKVAGLIALDENSLVVVRSSGVISRFEWRTGQQSWGRNIGNLGEIVRVVTSRNRRFLLLIGRAGGRLLDTTDGLVLSGILMPPPAMDGSLEVFQSFNNAFVTDTGAIDVSAEQKQYRREPTTFSGDVRARLREILSEGLAGSSN